MTSDDAWEAAQEGAELVAERDFVAALRELQALIERQPKNEYAYFFLGSAYFELGEHKKALRAYVTALELAPGYVGAMISAGHSLRLLGRYDQAIRMGQQVLARDKRDPDALFLLGESHFARGDNAAAEDYLQRFLATNPELENATEAEAMLQVIAGQIVPAAGDPEPD